MFCVQEATSGIVNRFKQHHLQIGLSIATYIIFSGMSVYGASVQTINMEIMSLLPTNTPGGITTYIECTAMLTPRKPMLNSQCTICTEDSTCFNIFPVSWGTSNRPTSFIKCRLACFNSLRSGLSTCWRRMNSSTSMMQSGYPFLLTTTSHQKISQMRKFFNGMERRWMTWAGTCLE